MYVYIHDVDMSGNILHYKTIMCVHVCISVAVFQMNLLVVRRKNFNNFTPLMLSK